MLGFQWVVQTKNQQRIANLTVQKKAKSLKYMVL
jgi:hypothetical protein